jgi:hypothetical protein
MCLQLCVLYGNFFEASNEVALLRQGLGPAYSHPHRLGVKSAFAQCPACLVALFPVAEEEEEHAPPHRLLPVSTSTLSQQSLQHAHRQSSILAPSWAGGSACVSACNCECPPGAWLQSSGANSGRSSLAGRTGLQLPCLPLPSR